MTVFRNILAMTGTTMLKLKQKTWNKLKNINKHKNIHAFGIEYCNNNVCKIVGC